MTNGHAIEASGRLLELTVVDLALIDRLRLSLRAGFNVLTGETGAGKSLVIDALGLALGARADTTLVRHGADAARVEALFDRAPEPTIAVREVSASGRSTARLDDETVTAGRLAASVGPLVEIHGQHDQQRLLDEDWQRDLLDAFGGHVERRAAVAAAVERWRANRGALAELAIDPRELVRRLEIVEHEAAEIAEAGLRVGEAEEIVQALGAAQHAERIAAGGQAARAALLGDGRGARDRLAEAETELRGLSRLDPRWDQLAERLAGLEADAQDIAAEVRTLAETVDHDPAAIARLEDRLGVIHRLDPSLRGRRGGRDRPWRTGGCRGSPPAGARRRARRACGRGRAAAGPRSAGRPRQLSPIGAATAVELGRAVAACWPSSGFRPMRSRWRSGRRPAARGRAGGRDRRRRGGVRRDRDRRRGVQLPPEPRRAGAVAGADRIGRGAVARRARGEAGARGGRCDAHARVRRDRHRDRRPERGPGRAQPVDAGAAATRCCA